MIIFLLTYWPIKVVECGEASLTFRCSATWLAGKSIIWHHLAIYPLVNVYMTTENHHFSAKTRYFYGHFQQPTVSHYQRVDLFPGQTRLHGEGDRCSWCDWETLYPLGFRRRRTSTSRTWKKIARCKRSGFTTDQHSLQGHSLYWGTYESMPKVFVNRSGHEQN